MTWLCNLLLHFFFYFRNYLIGLVYWIKNLWSESLGKKRKKKSFQMLCSTLHRSIVLFKWSERRHMQRQIIITPQPPEIGARIHLKGLPVSCQSACFQTPSLIHHSHWTAHQTDGQLVITTGWCWKWGLAKTSQSHWWGCQHFLFYCIMLHMGTWLIKVTNDFKKQLTSDITR